MAKVLTFKTNYQPAHKFSNDAILALACLLEKSYVGEMLDRDFTPTDIRELFTASIDEACKLHYPVTEVPDSKYQVGQLIYNRGDMANQPGWFKITEVHDKLYDMAEVGGDRTCKRIYESMINEVDKQNGSTRFVTEQAYNTAREAAIKRIEETAAKHRNDKDEVKIEGSVMKNKYCFVEYDEENKKFHGGDLTDHYNEPRFYNTTKRSHKKAATALIKTFNNSTTMHDAINILEDNGIRCHSWCSMD